MSLPTDFLGDFRFMLACRISIGPSILTRLQRNDRHHVDVAQHAQEAEVFTHGLSICRSAANYFHFDAPL